MDVVRNYVETAIRKELERQKKGFSLFAKRCWCLLCEGDVQALSLSRVAPLFCRVQSYGLMARRLREEEVKDALARALHRVGSHPKHPKGKPFFYPHQVELMNFSLQVARQLAPQVMEELAVSCTCPGCQMDTVALALNRTRCRYGVRTDGTLLMPPWDLDFLRSDLEPVIRQASLVVGRRPHH
jgi:hypothetical protein